MSDSAAYPLKRRDPEFARLWAEAMAEGAERLRAAVMAHQLGQLASGENPSGEELAAARDRAGSPAPFDPRLAMETLKTMAALDGRNGGRGDKPHYASDAEVTQLLMERLENLAKRRGRA